MNTVAACICEWMANSAMPAAGARCLAMIHFLLVVSCGEESSSTSAEGATAQ